ncbi:hypothetical protein [Roseateles chitinivorans]|uniref:hypothetical protein n=1 Tax=Roseateles chitinivorans TaxID=2917965 RepID=UPI003D6774FA
MHQIDARSVRPVAGLGVDVEHRAIHGRLPPDDQDRLAGGWIQGNSHLRPRIHLQVSLHAQRRCRGSELQVRALRKTGCAGDGAVA